MKTCLTEGLYFLTVPTLTAEAYNILQQSPLRGCCYWLLSTTNFPQLNWQTTPLFSSLDLSFCLLMFVWLNTPDRNQLYLQVYALALTNYQANELQLLISSTVKHWQMLPMLQWHVFCFRLCRSGQSRCQEVVCKLKRSQLKNDLITYH